MLMFTVQQDKHDADNYVLAIATFYLDLMVR